MSCKYDFIVNLYNLIMIFSVLVVCHLRIYLLFIFLENKCL